MAPTWRGAFWRGFFGAAVFFLLLLLAFQRPFVEAATLSVVMLALYVPLGYYVDRFFYRRRQAQQRKAIQQEKQKR